MKKLNLKKQYQPYYIFVDNIVYAYTYTYRNIKYTINELKRLRYKGSVIIRRSKNLSCKIYKEIIL